jgi:hypothetical protein
MAAKHHFYPRRVKRTIKRTPRGSMHNAVEYDARVDSKKRVTIRNTKVDYFRVIEAKDGTVLLKPRVLKDAGVSARVLKDAPVSPRTLRCIGKSIANAKAGKRSKPVDLKALAAMKL